MNPREKAGEYYCPMHADVRRPAPAKCPQCGMALVPEGARFGLLRHMTGNPLMLAVMAAIMFAIMWVIFM